MSIAQTLREIADWDIRPLVRSEDWKQAMAFFEDLFSELQRWDLYEMDDGLLRNLLLLMAAEVAEDEGL